MIHSRTHAVPSDPLCSLWLRCWACQRGRGLRGPYKGCSRPRDCLCGTPAGRQAFLAAHDALEAAGLGTSGRPTWGSSSREQFPIDRG